MENYVYVQFPLSPPIALKLWWLKNDVLSFLFPITLSLEKVVVKELSMSDKFNFQFPLPWPKKGDGKRCICLTHSVPTSPCPKKGDGKRSMSDPFPPPLKRVTIKEVCLTCSVPTSPSLALKKWWQKNHNQVRSILTSPRPKKVMVWWYLSDVCFFHLP